MVIVLRSRKIIHGNFAWWKIEATKLSATDLSSILATIVLVSEGGN